MAINIPQMQPGCPWSELSSWMLPNVKWCEAQQCSWIVEPLNTWSNFSYIILGFIMWYLARKEGSKTMALFGPSAIACGSFSFLYHMSYTFVFQVGDFLGMYIFTGLICLLNMRRLGWISVENQVKYFLAFIVFFTALTPVVHFLGLPIQGIVFIHVIFFIWSEFKLRNLNKFKPNYKWLYLGLFFIIIAISNTLLDLTRTICDPHGWYQGHAVWHLLSAIAVACTYPFFRQFDLDNFTGPEKN
jgi:hypothetical protein